MWAITSPARSIVDCTFAYVEPEQIRLSIQQVIQRGLAAPDELRTEADRRPTQVQNLIHAFLEAAQ